MYLRNRMALSESTDSARFSSDAAPVEIDTELSALSDGTADPLKANGWRWVTLSTRLGPRRTV